MMNHNQSSHLVPSALRYRSTPYLLSQDQTPGLHIPVLSMPDILEAFQQAHPSSDSAHPSFSAVRNTGSGPWELPELKWLDPPEKGPAPTENATDMRKIPERFAVEGLRWPLSPFYGSDPVAASTDVSPAQFSLMTTPPASIGPSVPQNICCGISSMYTMSNLASRDFPSPSVPTAAQWLKHNSTGSSRGSLKRPLPFEGPDSYPNLDISNFDGPTLNVRVAAQTPSLRESLISIGEVSVPVVANEFKRSKLQQVVVASTALGGGSRKGSSTTMHNRKTTTMKPPEYAGLGLDTKKPAPVPSSDHEIHIWTERERRKKMNGMFSTLHSLLPHLTTKADKSTIVDEAITYIQTLEATMKDLMKRAANRALIPSTSSMIPSSLMGQQASQNATAVEMENLLPVPRYLKPSGGSVNLAPTMSREPHFRTPRSVYLTPTMSREPHFRTPRSVNITPTISREPRFQTLCSPNLVLNVCGKNAFISLCSPRGTQGLLCRVLFVMEKLGLQVLSGHINTTEDTVMYMIQAESLDPNKPLADPELSKIVLQDLRSCLVISNAPE